MVTRALQQTYSLFGRRESLLGWGQALLVISIWWLAQSASDVLGIPIPGSLVGLFVLWLLLDRGLVRMDWIERGADGLLNHLMLFFVPAMLALVDHSEFLSLLGVKLLLSVFASTIFVMCGTACVVELGFRIRNASSR